MKTCTKCSQSKPLDDFHKHKSAKGGLNPSCKTCVTKASKDYYEYAKIHGKRGKVAPHLKLPEGMSKCARCKEVKEKENFYKDAKRGSGVSSYCKPCATIKIAERKDKKGDEILAVRRKWAEENREHLREKDRLYREANRDKMVVTEAKRRARKKALPDTLTHEETNEILSHFNGKCALCDSPSEALDHFIPLKTGHGGTTKENIIPLCRDMNSSKSARNPFEWAETHLNEDAQSRFNQTVEYLSELNGLTVEQYREFVFLCFKIKPKNKNIS